MDGGPAGLLPRHRPCCLIPLPELVTWARLLTPPSSGWHDVVPGVAPAFAADGLVWTADWLACFFATAPAT